MPTVDKESDMVSTDNDGSLVSVEEEAVEGMYTREIDPETGDENWFCKQCEFKSNTKKGVKIHLKPS